MSSSIQGELTSALTANLAGKGIPVKNGGNGHAANEGLSAAARTVPVPPTKKRFSFGSLKVPRVGQIVQSPEERQMALQEFQGFKVAVAESMAECVGQIRQIESMEKGSYERRMNSGAEESLRNAIAEMLSYGEPAAKDVSVLEYSKAMISTCPEFRGWVEYTLKELAQVGFLSSSDSTGSGRGVRAGEVRVYNKLFWLTDAFARNVEAQAVLNEINSLFHRTVEAGKKRFDADLVNVKAGAGENPLSVADLKAGKPGRIVLEVPEQIYQGRMLKGGWLLVESEDRKICVLDSAGYIQSKADKMRENGTFVFSDQLGREKLELAVQLPEEAFNKVFVLWKWLSMACKVAEDKANAEALAQKWAEQVAAERAEIEKGATLTAEEFLLAGKPGTFFYDFGIGQVFNLHVPVEGQVRNKVVNVLDVFCLVERDERGYVRVADCPERLKGFWVDHREFEEPGDKLYNLGKLGAMLRIGYAKASKAARDAGRTVERVKLADVTAELAMKVGVDPSTLNLESETESAEDREARIRANSIKPDVHVPKHGNSRPAHATAAVAE